MGIVDINNFLLKLLIYELSKIFSEETNAFKRLLSAGNSFLGESKDGVETVNKIKKEPSCQSGAVSHFNLVFIFAIFAPQRLSPVSTYIIWPPSKVTAML